MNHSTLTLGLSSLLLSVFAGCASHHEPGHGADGGVSPRCVVGGCSGQLCVSADVEPPVTTCEWREEYACYDNANCTVQDNGACGWTATPELEACLAEATDPTPPVPTEEPPAPTDECVVGGCSGQLCIAADADGTSTCEWREEYACFAYATCEKQPSGKCGWTQTDELTECLADAQGAAKK
jgi:hypothetical protein